MCVKYQNASKWFLSFCNKRFSDPLMGKLEVSLYHSVHSFIPDTTNTKPTRHTTELWHPASPKLTNTTNHLLLSQTWHAINCLSAALSVYRALSCITTQRHHPFKTSFHRMRDKRLPLKHNTISCTTIRTQPLIAGKTPHWLTSLWRHTDRIPNKCRHHRTRYFVARKAADRYVIEANVTNKTTARPSVS